MIEERYMSFEQAKLLSELAFAQECHNYYLEDGHRFQHCHQEVLPKNQRIYDCPSVMMTMEWIITKHLFFPEFHLCLGDNSDKGRYMVGVYEQTAIDTYTWKTWIFADGYTDACSKFVDYTLKLIKSEQDTVEKEDKE